MGVLKKYGAGVIGSLYAAKLIKRGHDVTILARGERLSELSRYGLVIEHAITWVIERYEVKTIGIPIIPGKLNFFVLPNAILVQLFRRLLSGKSRRRSWSSTRFSRVDNGTLTWYDLDFPDVIEVKKQFYPETDRKSSLR